MFDILSGEDPKEVSKKLKNLLSSTTTKEDKAYLCNKKDENGNTAFHIAAKAGHFEAFKLLCESGAEMNIKNQDMMTPLQFAARHGDQAQQGEVWRCMEWIMDENKKMVAKSKKSGTMAESLKDNHRYSLLHLAIQNPNWSDKPMVVEKLTKMGDFDVTDTDEQGNNCLHLAAQLEPIEEEKKENKVLNALLSGKDSNVKKCLEEKNDQGKTPLECAIMAGNADSVDKLREAAKKFEISHDEILPLQIAARLVLGLNTATQINF